MNRIPKTGDVYMMDFSGRGSEQRGTRPGIVFQNNVGNKNSPNIIAIPLTSNTNKKRIPTHVFLDSGKTRLRKDSIALCENPETISKDFVGEYIVTLNQEQMRRISVGVLLATAAAYYIDTGIFDDVKKQTEKLNILV